MITLDNVSIWQPGSRRQKPILLNCSVHFGPRERVGILASAGSGKSSLARLLCGIDRPDVGHVIHQGRPSWPVGFAGFLHPELSVGQNLTTIAKLCGFPHQQALEFVSEFVSIPDVLARQTQNLSPSERARVAYAVSVLMPCDYLIGDDVITVGTHEMRRKCEAYLQTVLKNAGLILISRSVRQISEFCDRFYVLSGHTLTPCLDLAAAESVLELTERTAQRREPLDA